MPKERIERHFPNLAGERWNLTSQSDPHYNCIAFASHDDTRFWDPGMAGVEGYHWPPGAPREHHLQAWIKAFETQAYQLCENGDLEPEIEKIAIYVSEDGNPTHATRQLPDGNWTSKLDKAEDIEHLSPQSLEGVIYGKASVFMKRRLKSAI